ncbi:MAG: GNAT family N-acetyltransferase [Dysgonomonas sp.]|nr:GNAT family N-acetyltransferase [Dysgonomonas sp.]
MDILIKRVKLTDVESLSIVGKQSFYEAYSMKNTESDMKKYLEESFSIEKLTVELKDENSEFYFAILDNNIIGYLKLNSGQSQTDLKDNNSLEIERIYVLKKYYGKGVGQLFYKKAIEVARCRKVDYIWLGVWEENERAINFYKRNGFVEFGKHTFRLGDDVQNDILMKLDIR